jgi:hypothetical protein
MKEFRIKDNDIWRSPTTVYGKLSNIWNPAKEIYIKESGTWKPVYRDEGPQLRVLGGTFATNSATIPATLPITIPATAQVGDYLVVTCTNAATVQQPWLGGTYWSFQGGQTGVGTYTENVTINFKICTQQDIGATYQLYNGGFPIQAMVYVFTNPNKIGTTTPLLWGEYNNNDMYTESTQYLGNVSSMVTTSTPNRFKYELKIMAFAANGSSTYPTQTYSGPGSFRTLTDSYWWRSIGTSYATNIDVTFPAGTCSLANPSAVSWVSIRLI